MTRDIWVFSDHHFSHANILKFTDNETGNLVRPGFDNEDHMDEHMIEMWNQSIKPGDLVWHLGDITINYDKFANNIIKKLHGKIRMCIGNHDDIKFLVGLGRIQKLVETRRFDEFGMILSHRVLHPSNLWSHRRGERLINIHGHIHQNKSPDGPYINVCVEQTGYKPIHIEDLKVTVSNMLKEEQ